jgi:hypothetical protein
MEILGITFSLGITFIIFALVKFYDALETAAASRTKAVKHPRKQARFLFLSGAALVCFSGLGGLGVIIGRLFLG